MSFPIKFFEQKPYDVLSPLGNIAANAVVVATAAIALAILANSIAKSLGASTLTSTIIVGIPNAVTIGAGTVVIGALALLCYALKRSNSFPA